MEPLTVCRSQKFAASDTVEPQLPHHQLNLFRASPPNVYEKFVRKLSGLDIESVTPIEAIVKLGELREGALELTGEDAEAPEEDE